MKDKIQNLGETQLTEVIRTSIPGDLAFKWKAKQDQRVELDIQRRHNDELTTLQLSHHETKDFLSRLLEVRKSRVSRLELVGGQLEAGLCPAFASNRALSPEHSHAWKEIARDAAKRYPQVAADVIYRKMYGLYRQALDRGESPKADVLMARIDRHMAATFERVYTEPALDPPSTVLAVHTVQIVHHGAKRAAKILITKHERGVLFGQLDCPTLAQCRFSWGTQNLPQAEDPTQSEMLHSAAYHLAAAAWSAEYYSKKADLPPKEKLLRPHVRRPSIGRSATVVNGYLADPETLKCLRAEAELWNKASRLIPGVTRRKSQENRAEATLF